MKRSKILISFILIMLISTQCNYADGIKVFVDKVQVKFDVTPLIENGRTLVPMRAIFEALGADEIHWDNETKTAAAYKGDIGIAVQVGNNVANVNNVAVPLDVAPIIINGRTLVPLRFIGEAFDCTVNWDGGTQTITIVSKSEMVSNDSVDSDNGKGSNNTSNDIVGFWSTSVFSDVFVDAATGLPVDDYTGDWYVFREDGTFTHLIIGSGLVLSGSAIQNGNYKINDGTIEFSEVKESWYPKPGSANSVKEYKNKSIGDKVVPYEIKNDNQILVIDDSSIAHKRVNN